MKPFVKGDIDGFFALGLDNLLMLILMSSLCLGFLQFSPDLFYGRILPATAIGLVIGNLFYARQALQLARKENRTDVCAIPYGPSLLTIFVFVFLVMYPAQQKALTGFLAEGMSQEEAKAAADIVAWQAGLIACFASGLIEFFGAFVAERLRSITPRAALLAALAGIGLFFIGVDFIFRAWMFPIVGMSTLAITLVIYFGRVRFNGGVPAGFVILLVGTVLSWIFYRGTLVGTTPIDAGQFGLRLPIPVIGDLVASFSFLVEYLPIIIPIGFIHLILSLQNIESAAAAGDSYASKPALAFNGLGTLAAACFGSPFATSIYIGHPGWKALGARAGYSTANAMVMSLICFSGTLSVVVWLVPIEAGMAILIWIGVMMATQAFNATPNRHAPAVVIGLIPAVGAFAAMILKHGLFIGSDLAAGETLFTPETVASLMEVRNFFADGLFAMEQGYVFSSIILAAATVAIIEQQFNKAALWFLLGGALSAVGFIHQYQFTFTDVVPALGFSLNKWVVGYAIMAAIVALVPYLTHSTDRQAEPV
ncbi:MAG: NCS2 family permease [Opitutales bacterium]